MSWNSLATDNQDWSNLVANAPAGAPAGPTFSFISSDVFTNNSGSQNLDVRVTVEAKTLAAAPSGATPQFIAFVVLEEEIEPGVFRVIADSTAQPLNKFTELPTEREFVVQERNPGDTGQPFSFLGGFRFNANKSPSEKMRVCVAVQDSRAGGEAALETITVSGSYRLY